MSVSPPMMTRVKSPVKDRIKAVSDQRAWSDSQTLATCAELSLPLLEQFPGLTREQLEAAVNHLIVVLRREVPKFPRIPALVSIRR